ncbi:gpW family head-tail joining protein [Bosea sp. TWI1241]|uniref:gpW family head-tail joining protein n=1 Tax=Bosea sp. TWI1241 TaxID=3148904 RepID=UPI003207D519
MTLSSEDIAALQLRLREAKAARHQLLTVGGVVKTMSKSLDSVQEIQWTPARLADLERYIAEMERELGLCPSVTRARSRRVVF